MALTTTTTPVSNPVQEQPTNNNPVAEASILSMLVLTMYAANKSKKELRKLKRKFLWTSFKLKVNSLFSKKATDRQILLYVIIGVLALALIIVSPIAALIVALLGLILILTGTI